MTKKYSTLAALKAAYDSGELSREHPLILDNDSCDVYVDGECVYEGWGPQLVAEEALTMLNIPWGEA